MTDRPDFEADPDFTAVPQHDPAPTGPDGTSVLNALPASDEFDPRYAADLEGLLFLGKLSNTVHIFGHSFTLKTLTRGERLACAQLCKDYEDTLGFADALQTAYVAACVTHVDGQSLVQPLTPNEHRDPIVWIRQNFDVVREWFDPVIETVYEKYNDLLVRQTQAFIELEGKY